MQPIDAILFEPVGCLAEFASDEFDAIAARIFGRSLQSFAPGRPEPADPAVPADPKGPALRERSGSEAYWNLLNLLHTADKRFIEQQQAIMENHEVEAVEHARAYEDVAPALSELKELGVTTILASSLSATAVTRFLDRHSLSDCFAAVWNRDTAGGVKDVPLLKAVSTRSLTPARVMFITDTAEGLRTAKQVGVNAILMMNDPDEAMKLTAHEPTGGIVSLHELPDFVRLVAAKNATAQRF